MPNLFNSVIHMLNQIYNDCKKKERRRIRQHIYTHNWNLMSRKKRESEREREHLLFSSLSFSLCPITIEKTDEWERANMHVNAIVPSYSQEDYPIKPWIHSNIRLAFLSLSLCQSIDGRRRSIASGRWNLSGNQHIAGNQLNEDFVSFLISTILIVEERMCEKQ